MTRLEDGTLGLPLYGICVAVHLPPPPHYLITNQNLDRRYTRRAVRIFGLQDAAVDLGDHRQTFVTLAPKLSDGAFDGLD